MPQLPLARAPPLPLPVRRRVREGDQKRLPRLLAPGAARPPPPLRRLPTSLHLGTLSAAVIRFFLLQNRAGKTRLAKYYTPLNDEDKMRTEVRRGGSPGRHTQNGEQQRSALHVACLWHKQQLSSMQWHSRRQSMLLHRAQRRRRL